MEIIKIVGIALVTVISYIILKQSKPEFATIVSLVGGTIILIMFSSYLSSVLTVFNNLIEKTGVNRNLISIVIKIIGIGYLAEFGSGVCNDAGCSSVGDKVILAGKVLILISAMPIVTSLIDILVGILP